MDHTDKKARKQDAAFMIHEEQYTNLTLFRKYLVGVLKGHPALNHKLPVLVRQLQPTEYGLPIEIVAFVKGTDGLTFEEFQSDLFDHILAVLPEFELDIFQVPSGNIRTVS